MTPRTCIEGRSQAAEERARGSDESTARSHVMDGHGSHPPRGPLRFAAALLAISVGLGAFGVDAEAQAPSETHASDAASGVHDGNRLSAPMAELVCGLPSGEGREISTLGRSARDAADAMAAVFYAEWATLGHVVALRRTDFARTSTSASGTSGHALTLVELFLEEEASAQPWSQPYLAAMVSLSDCARADTRTAMLLDVRPLWWNGDHVAPRLPDPWPEGLEGTELDGDGIPDFVRYVESGGTDDRGGAILVASSRHRTISALLVQDDSYGQGLVFDGACVLDGSESAEPGATPPTVLVRTSWHPSGRGAPSECIATFGFRLESGAVQLMPREVSVRLERSRSSEGSDDESRGSARDLRSCGGNVFEVAGRGRTESVRVEESNGTRGQTSTAFEVGGTRLGSVRRRPRECAYPLVLR